MQWVSLLKPVLIFISRLSTDRSKNVTSLTRILLSRWKIGADMLCDQRVFMRCHAQSHCLSDSGVSAVRPPQSTSHHTFGTNDWRQSRTQFEQKPKICVRFAQRVIAINEITSDFSQICDSRDSRYSSGVWHTYKPSVCGHTSAIDDWLWNK